MHAHDSNFLGHLQGPALPMRVKVDPPLLKVFLQSSAHYDGLLTVAMLFCQCGLKIAAHALSFADAIAQRMMNCCGKWMDGEETYAVLVSSQQHILLSN